MCRNIKMLFNFNPPVTPDEVRAASLQFVRKISGFNKPSKANEAAFLAAIDAIASVSTQLLTSLETNAPPRSREEEAAKANSATPRDSPHEARRAALVTSHEHLHGIVASHWSNPPACQSMSPNSVR